VLEVHGLTSAEIGAAAAREGLELHELIPRTASLEEAFLGLTDQAVEFGGAADERGGQPASRMAHAADSQARPVG